jgi:hypothetical protein
MYAIQPRLFSEADTIDDSAPQLYLTPEETRAFYHAIALVMKGGRG